VTTSYVALSPGFAWVHTANTLQLFLSDPGAKFSKSIGWADAEGRTGRYAIILDHGKVTYAAREKEMNALEVSDATTILKNL
jgi:alkyl hydroperoxide reductase 1